MVFEFELSKNDFAYLQKLAFEYAGINLSGHKQMLVYNRLVKRLRALGLSNFNEYCELLKANDSEERRIFLDSITTTLTSFFRENHQFEYLKKVLLPEWLQSKKTSNTLKIWSAGCATGEEAYSIAITASEIIPADHNYDIKILATDINLDALETAKEGIYPAERINNVDMSYKKRCFLKGVGDMQDYVQVKPEIRHLITFKQLNLMEEWPLTKAFDVIFCRNVVIYFNKETQRILFNRFADLLEPPLGALVIGHSESLYKLSERFKHIGNNIYRKLQ